MDRLDKFREFRDRLTEFRDRLPKRQRLACVFVVWAAISVVGLQEDALWFAALLIGIAVVLWRFDREK